MRRVTFQSVLHGAARIAGLDPTRDLREPATSDLCEFINTAVAIGWRWDFWTEWTLIEERTRAGDATNGYYFPLEQTGKTTIEALKDGVVFKRNPKVYPTNPWSVKARLTDQGILLASAPATVWAEFRPAPPEFAVTTWADSASYVLGDRRYRSNNQQNGETYVALQASTNKDPLTETAYWQRVDFPAALADYVKHAAAAEYKRKNGQDERADELATMADEKLRDAQDREMDSQGQHERAGASTYGR